MGEVPAGHADARAGMARAPTCPRALGRQRRLRLFFPVRVRDVRGRSERDPGLLDCPIRLPVWTSQTCQAATTSRSTSMSIMMADSIVGMIDPFSEQARWPAQHTSGKKELHTTNDGIGL